MRSKTPPAPAPVPDNRTRVVWNITPELLTTTEAARLLGIGARTLWRHSRTGAAPAPVKIGGTVRYRKSQLLIWIEENCPRCDGGHAND